ncbi:MAG: inositol monophosphatase family protein [Desulfobacterales bacterium]
MGVDRIMRVAERAAFRGADVLRLRFGRLDRVDEKAPFDLVTDADTEAENAITAVLQPWDTAAGCLIVREAGGRVTDFEGRPFLIGEGEIMATNRRVQDEMVALMEADQT